MTFTPRLSSGALSLALLAFASVSPAAPLIGGLGGPAGFGPNTLAPNDDGSTGEIDIRGAFPAGLRYFGTTFNSLWVNNNGNVTFGGPQGGYTPNAFPVSNLRMIAPWWGDVDTRGGGMPGRNGVYWSITPGRMVATWHNVGYFSTHDDLSNDFQLVLTAAGSRIGDFDVEFRYNTCQWTTGDASSGTGGFGGIAAQAGFDAGNLRDFVALPGSLSMAVLNLCATSNVAEAGVWRFTIRDGAVMCPGMGETCSTGRPGVCGPGTVACVGTGSSCVSRVPASAEVCNGIDDDCDGTPDDGVAPRVCYTGRLGTQGVGLCHTGLQPCSGGAFGACEGEALPAVEVCNGVDDDCNGLADDVAGSLLCGIGACRRAVPNCAGGVMGVCFPGEPRSETCNGIDDDCDGVIDNAQCTDPDGGTPPDGNPIPDSGTPPADAGADASTCHDYRCNPDLWLNGKAGPFGGCGCDVPGSATSHHRAPWLLALALGAFASRRARRA